MTVEYKYSQIKTKFSKTQFPPRIYIKPVLETEVWKLKIKREKIEKTKKNKRNKKKIKIQK